MLHACLLEEASGFRIFEPYRSVLLKISKNIWPAQVHLG